MVQNFHLAGQKLKTIARVGFTLDSILFPEHPSPYRQCRGCPVDNIKMRPDTTEETFEPVWWLPEGHSQTLWRKFAGAETVEHARNRVELKDGDFIDVDFLSASHADAARQRALVVLLHGLCGSSSSTYILSLQLHLSKEGFSSVAMNFRGCSGELNRRGRAYHSGVSDDLQEVLNAVIETFNPDTISLVGYSLGGNVLLLSLIHI